MLTQVVSRRLELGDVDVAGAPGQLGNDVVAGRQLRLGEDAGHDLARGIVAAAHSAGVGTLVRSHDPVAADGLCADNSRRNEFF